MPKVGWINRAVPSFFDSDRAERPPAGSDPSMRACPLIRPTIRVFLAAICAIGLRTTAIAATHPPGLEAIGASASASQVPRAVNSAGTLAQPRPRCRPATLAEAPAVMFAESFWYLWLGGMGQCVVIPAIAVLLLPVAAIRGFRCFWRWLRSALIFNLFLFAWGAIGDALFTSLFRCRLYVPGDPLIDFLPYFPSVGLAVSYPDGGWLFPEVSSGTFYLAWAAVAAPVWAAAILSFRAWRRARPTTP